MNTKRILPLLLLAALALLFPVAPKALTAAEAFTSAPKTVFPLLDSNTRLDMVDYFNAGIQRASTNRAESGSQITALADEALTLKLSDASEMQLCLLPTRGEPVIMVITTVKTPAPDSSIAFYDASWNPLGASSLLKSPALADWVTDKGRLADVEAVVPFMLASASYKPGDKSLVFTNNLAVFLADDMYSDIAPMMRPTLTFRWNNKNFSPLP